MTKEMVFIVINGIDMRAYTREDKAKEKYEEIMDVIKALAHSQGYYSRLYGTLKEHPEVLEFLEKQNFKKTD